MPVGLTIEEVFKIAVQMEEMGAEFYRKGAALVGDKRVSKVLYDLAVMEDHHATTFMNMLKNLLRFMGKKSYVSKNEEFLHLLVDDYVFFLATSPTDVISEGANVREIIQLAIQKEKESVVFYSFFQRLFERDEDKKKVEAIVNEELQHIATLRRALGISCHQMKT